MSATVNGTPRNNDEQGQAQKNKHAQKLSQATGAESGGHRCSDMKQEEEEEAEEEERKDRKRQKQQNHADSLLRSCRNSRTVN